jgi:hypothetical protein
LDRVCLNVAEAYELVGAPYRSIHRILMRLPTR